MELVSIAQMQKADKYTIESLGIPGKTLMYSAAAAICTEVLSSAAGKSGFSAAVFCGPGNNGGDGWAAASILFENKIDVSVFTGCSIDSLKGDAAYYAQIAADKGIAIIQDTVPQDLNNYDVVIDALFGIGLKRKIDGIYKDYILMINNRGRHVISADIPSGLYSDEGVPFSYAVKADCTVTFGRVKAALVSQPGCVYAGKIILDKIGIPDEAYENSEIQYTAVDSAFVREIVKPRKRISSKGSYGRVLMITGSPGMTGATALCAEACLRSGAGLVYCAVPGSMIFEYDSLVREAISIPIRDNGRDFITSDGTEDIVKAAQNKSAVVIGPGLSVNSDSHIIFSALKDSVDIPIITDAQTLNDISSHMDVLEKNKKNIIFTPHPGEMSRLIGKSIEFIQENRISTAVEFARKYNVIVLLKGHRTVVTDGRHVYLNTTGNPGMATAGSGDVLCGITAAFTALTDNMAKAAASAAYIHGAAGDRAAAEYGEYSMKSGDIVAGIPLVMKTITGV